MPGSTPPSRLLAFAALALLPFAGCGGGPGHFDSDSFADTEAARMDSLSVIATRENAMASTTPYAAQPPVKLLAPDMDFHFESSADPRDPALLPALVPDMAFHDGPLNTGKPMEPLQHPDEAQRLASLAQDPHPDTTVNAPRGATAAALASDMKSSLVFHAGGNAVLQIDGMPASLDGKNPGSLPQDMAHMLLRNVMEMQVHPRTGLPLYIVTVRSPGGNPTVDRHPLATSKE